MTRVEARAAGVVGRAKVLLLCKHAGFGGTERFVQHLAFGLRRYGVTARVVLPRSEASPDVLAWFGGHGVEAEAISPVGSHTRIADVLPLGRFVRALNVDTVNLHYAWSGIPLKDVFAVRILGRTRCVVSLHLLEAPSFARRTFATLLAAFLCDAIIVLDDSLRARLVRAGVPASKVHVIPVGVPASRRSIGRAVARQELGIPPDAFVVSTVARLTAIKGIDLLIDALARLPDPDSRIHLLVAGTGPARPGLEAAARERLAGRGRFLGFVNEPAPVYAAADVFALPSLQEGIPLAILEAAHHGIPAVGSDLSGVRRAIVDQQTGLIVPPGNAQALADAIDRFRVDPVLRERCGLAARRHVETAFDAATVIRRYADILAPS